MCVRGARGLQGQAGARAGACAETARPPGCLQGSSAIAPLVQGSIWHTEASVASQCVRTRGFWCALQRVFVRCVYLRCGSAHRMHTPHKHRAFAVAHPNTTVRIRRIRIKSLLTHAALTCTSSCAHPLPCPSLPRPRPASSPAGRQPVPPRRLVGVLQPGAAQRALRGGAGGEPPSSVYESAALDCLEQRR